MDNIPNRTELTGIVVKIFPPLILSIMAKIASEYKKGKRISLLANIVIVCLAGCGAIVGYWVTKLLGWTEYKMTLTIFFFGLFSDKLFEFLFSKTFINGLFNFAEDWMRENLRMILDKLTKK
jgi:MFS family permease